MAFICYLTQSLTGLKFYSQKPKKLSFESIWDVLRDLVPFVQFKKREKHPWLSSAFSK